jgi:hypothetical protein
MDKRWTHKCGEECDRMQLRRTHDHAHQVFRDERRKKLRGKRPKVRPTTNGIRFIPFRNAVSDAFLAVLGGQS